MASGKTVVLEASQAQVTTCTVSIQTLRIGNRQLTQAVFKQLPRCDLISDYSLSVRRPALAGTVWGWVNYDLSHAQHKNFVVQKGEQLYRADFWIASVDEMVAESRTWGRGINYITTQQYRVRPPQNLMWFFMEQRETLSENRRFIEMWDDLMYTLDSAEQLYIAA